MANVLSLVAREASSTSVWVSVKAHTLLPVPTQPYRSSKKHFIDIGMYYDILMSYKSG